MKHCTQCSREYPDGSLFCTQCGLPLAEGAAEVPPPAEAEGVSAPAVNGAGAPASEAEEAAVVEAVPVSVAVVLEEPAPAPPPPGEASPPEETPARAKRRGVEARLGFARHLGAFCLCVLLFVFLLIPAVVFQVRDASSEAWIAGFLRDVELSDHIDSDDLEDALEDWLRTLDPALETVRVDMSDAASDIDKLIDRSTVKGSVAAQIARYLDSIYSGASAELFSKEDIAELLAENGAIINGQLEEMFEDLGLDGSGFRLARAGRLKLAEALSVRLEDSGARVYLDTATMKQEAPAVYYGLRFGCSYITAGLSLVLAVLMFVCLVKVLKSGRRAANRAGIVLTVLGGLLTALALFQRLFVDLWLELFQGAGILARLVGQVLYTHILVDAAILAAGVVLLVVTGLLRRARARKREKMPAA